MLKFLARRGAVGGTARWVAKRFYESLPGIDLDNIEKNGEIGRKKELQKIVDHSLRVRGTMMPQGEVEELKNTYSSLPPGLVNFTVAILEVEAGFFENSYNNMEMFKQVIKEELVKKGVGDQML